LLENDIGKKLIPLSNGLEIRVILGGVMAGTCRALIGIYIINFISKIILIQRNIKLKKLH
jgi:hypothetical protein